MLYKVVLSFKSVDSCYSAIQMKLLSSTSMHATALFIILFEEVLTFNSMDRTLVFDHSIESYGAVLSCGIVYYAVPSSSNFQVYRQNISVHTFKGKLSMRYCLLCVQ